MPAPRRLRGGEHREAEPHPRHHGAHLPARATGARPRRRSSSSRPASSPRRRWSTPPSTASSSPPTRRAPGPAPSAATSPRTPAARTASSTAPASTTSSRGGWRCPRAGTLDRPARRPPAPQDPPRRHRHASRWRTRHGARGARASSCAAREIRKKGLWKDITNKALGGVPGLQKEGTDGVITSAEFILYPEYEAKRTLCLEFFGPDFDEASRVILELVARVPLPERRAGGALGARALRRRVRPGHRLQGEGAARRDAEGGAARRRGRPRARRGRRAASRRIRAILAAHPNTLLVRGARRGRGQALLGRPQEARRHRAAHQRLQDERGRGPPARRRSPSSRASSRR